MAVGRMAKELALNADPAASPGAHDHGPFGESAARTDGQATRARRLPALTSLRFFLSLTVALIHYNGQVAPLRFADALDAIPHLVTGFYMLSGFLLTYQYTAAGWHTRASTFWKARIARIVPLYWFCLAATVMVLPLRFFIPDQSKWSLISATNLSFLHGWSADPDVYFGWIPPAYTLSAEAFFYACFPAIMLTWARWRWWLVVSAAFALGIPVAAATTGRPDLATYAHVVCPLSRLLEFVLGCGLARVFHRYGSRAAPRGVVACLELILLAIVAHLVLTGGWVWHISQVPKSVQDLLYDRGWSIPFYIGLVWLLAGQRGVIARALSWPVFVFLGEASYALFLVHDIVVRFMMSHRDSLPAIAPALQFALYLVISIGLSSALLVLVERPWRTAILHSGRFVRPAVQTLVLAMALVVVGGSWNVVYYLAMQRHSSPVHGADDVGFGEAHTLHGLHARQREGDVELLSLWETGSHPSRGLFLTLQVVDASGRDLWASTKVIAPPVPTTRRWAESFRVPLASLPGAQDLGISVSDSQAALPVSGGRRDWSDRRLLVPFPHEHRMAMP